MINRNYVLRLKGIVSRDVELGSDASGNILRIDNSIERLEKELISTKNNLENTQKQFETAKQEIKKPFAREKKLKTKLARLKELNILLNMDSKEVNDVSNQHDCKEDKKKTDPIEIMRHRDTDGDGVCDYIDSNGYTKPNDQYQYREISANEYAKLKEAGFDLNQKCKSSPTKADCFNLKCNAAERSQVDEILKSALNKAIKH